MGLITALITGITAGIFQVQNWYEYVPLILGSFLLCVVTKHAKNGLKRIYKRSLETITMRAKIETELGLTKPRNKTNKNNKSAWETEPIIAPRFLETREQYSNSKDFVCDRLNKGYMKQVNRLFYWVKLISIILGAYTTFLLIYSAKSQ